MCTLGHQHFSYTLATDRDSCTAPARNLFYFYVLVVLFYGNFLLIFYSVVNVPRSRLALIMSSRSASRFLPPISLLPLPVHQESSSPPVHLPLRTFHEEPSTKLPLNWYAHDSRFLAINFVQKRNITLRNAMSCVESVADTKRRGQSGLLTFCIFNYVCTRRTFLLDSSDSSICGRARATKTLWNQCELN